MIPSAERRSKRTTAEVEALLADRYAPPEYALLFNVKNQTGYGGMERYADAIAMNLYPSRGMEVIGFEIKISRSDWIKERDKPAKAEPLAQFCDRWFLVVGDAEIVKPGELPPTWGLLASERGKLAVVTEAPKLEAAPLGRRFVAALLRRAVEQSPAVVAAAERRGYERGYKAGESRTASQLASAHQSVKHGQEELLALRQQVHQFEQAAGISISGWRADHRIGEVVRLALDGRFNADLVKVRDQLARLLGAAEESLAALQSSPVDSGSANGRVL